MSTEDPNSAQPPLPPAPGYTYALVLLETATVKKFQNREDFRNALDAIGDRPKIILKWHEGAKQWTNPELA